MCIKNWLFSLTYLSDQIQIVLLRNCYELRNVICTVLCCVYWKWRKHARKEAKSTSLNITCTDPENLNMLHTKKGATRPFDVTDLDREAVRIQGSERPIWKVRFGDQMQCFESPANLDQFEKELMSVHITGH